MFDGREALASFEHGCTYIVETMDGYTRGVWDEGSRAFIIKAQDGSARLVEPSFLNPNSELVAWEKISEPDT